ncbi:EAL domain-containing protein [uncultured Jatrophihabitans sp.]|uniref:sensor domain-containing phosphodiesterase n=1 Tax=uncultured Jatrophihabitans sp. TaxID=1610747 RepID=UPI0035C97442
MSLAAVLGPRAEDVIRGGGVRALYQPIVDLDSGVNVAFEALARGPIDHPLRRPERLFDAARAAGCVRELDEACRSAALDGAVSAGLQAPWALFVNVEPNGLDWARTPGDLSVRQQSGARPFPVVVEITERDLADDPASLMRFVERVRAQGLRIALDDVGARPESLALLPLLRPDVIKLDLRLVQQRPTGEVAEIVTAVNAEAERSGAVLLAEGIETKKHLDFARGLGARLGQGWLFGRPGPMPDLTGRPRPAADAVPGSVRSQLLLDCTPYEAAAARISARTSRKPLLIEISKHLEHQAMRLGANVVLLATVQHAQFFTPATARRYRALADSAVFAAVLGEDVPAEPLPGLRGGRLAPTDPLVGEWDLTVVGPHFAAALLARDLGDTGPDDERRFDYVLTHDRDVVVAAAAALMSRVTPVQPPADRT